MERKVPNDIIDQAFQKMLIIFQNSANPPFLRHMNLRNILCKRLYDPHFKSAPASRNHHHNYPGGLVVHTYEVFQIAKSMIDSLPALNSPYEFSPYGLETDIEDRNTILRILFIASLYHDYCKVFEYDEFGNKTNWADQVGHVVGGYELFCEDMKDVISTELSGTERNEISHILLSHHGRKEWGSPVEPQTALAQMFHYADMLSSHYGKGK